MSNCSKSSQKPLAQIAWDLGIADRTLHHWRKQFSEHGEHAFPGSGHQTPHEEEMRRLQREVDLLRQERDILKIEHISGVTAIAKVSIGKVCMKECQSNVKNMKTMDKKQELPEDSFHRVCACLYKGNLSRSVPYLCSYKYHILF